MQDLAEESRFLFSCYCMTIWKNQVWQKGNECRHFKLTVKQGGGEVMVRAHNLYRKVHWWLTFSWSWVKGVFWAANVHTQLLYMHKSNQWLVLVFCFCSSTHLVWRNSWSFTEQLPFPYRWSRRRAPSPQRGGRISAELSSSCVISTEPLQKTHQQQRQHVHPHTCTLTFRGDRCAWGRGVNYSAVCWWRKSGLRLCIAKGGTSITCDSTCGPIFCSSVCAHIDFPFESTSSNSDYPV